MLVIPLVVAILAIATWTDFRWRKIFNWLTYPAILTAIGLNLLGSLAYVAGGFSGDFLNRLGLIGFSQSVLGFLTCGGILLACYVFFPVGGGDVKLMAALGAFLGPERGIEVLLWSFILGGCAALIIIIWRIGILELLYRLTRSVWHLVRWRAWIPLSAEDPAAWEPPLFLAPCALIAVGIVESGMGTWLW